MMSRRVHTSVQVKTRLTFNSLLLFIQSILWRADFVSGSRRGDSPASSGGSVWADRYPPTPALSLVGRGAVEYRAPQVMLHMACSLLRRIKCQLWNHLKDQRSVFLIRPEFGGVPCFYCPRFWNCGHNDLSYLDMGMSWFSHIKGAVKCYRGNQSSWKMYNTSFIEATIVLLSCWIYRHKTKVVFCGPHPVRPRPRALAANGILFWAITKLFSPSSILQEELPDT